VAVVHASSNNGLEVASHGLSLTFTKNGYLRTTDLLAATRSLACAHSARLSKTITLETKALIVRMYFKPHCAARAQKSSLV